MIIELSIIGLVNIILFIAIVFFAGMLLGRRL